MNFASIYQLDTVPEMSLDQLAGADTPDQTHPIELVLMTSPHLGDGLRGLRHVDTGGPDHDVAAVLHYVWRGLGGDGQSYDILVIIGDFDVVKLESLLPVFDALARSISFYEM